MLQQLAPTGALHAHPVGGRIWLGLETGDAVLAASDLDLCSSTLGSGKVLTGRSTCFTGLTSMDLGTNAPMGLKLSLGFSSNPHASEMGVLEQTTSEGTAQGGVRGFILGVPHIEEPVLHAIPFGSSPFGSLPFGSLPSMPTSPMVATSHDSQPFLSPGQHPHDSPALSPKKGGMISKMFSKEGNTIVDDAFVLSIPTTDECSTGAVQGSQGYLIAVPGAGDSNHVMFALPAASEAVAEEEACEYSFRLPTDVTDASIQYSLQPDQPGVVLQVSVSRTVPLLGYVLLLFACVAISSAGPAAELQTGTDPAYKLFWRSNPIPRTNHNRTAAAYEPLGRS